MAELQLKEIYSFVSYSDESAALLSIGFMVYSEKSFVFSIHLNKDRKEMKKNEVILFQEIKDYLGTDRDDVEAGKDSLKGKGNTRLKDAEGDSFFGYVYSISGGDRALRWFSERSSTLPSEEETKAAAADNEDEEQLSEVEIRQRSGHTYEELVQILEDLTGQKPREVKKAGKYQKPPHLVSGLKKGDIPSSPKKSSLPIKAKEIPGVPANRKAVPTVIKVPNQKDIQAAFDLIFTAMRLGIIEDTSEYASVYEDKNPEIKDVDNPSSILYKGYAGPTEAVRTRVKELSKVFTADLYDSGQIGPTLTLKLLTHRKEPLE